LDPGSATASSRISIPYVKVDGMVPAEGRQADARASGVASLATRDPAPPPHTTVALAGLGFPHLGDPGGGEAADHRRPERQWVPGDVEAKGFLLAIQALKAKIWLFQALSLRLSSPAGTPSCFPLPFCRQRSRGVFISFAPGMAPTAAIPSPGYRPRPPSNDLKEIVEDSLEDLLRIWDDRFQEKYGPLSKRVRELFETAAAICITVFCAGAARIRIVQRRRSGWSRTPVVPEAYARRVDNGAP
jgi:hypothetical protein